TCSVKDAVNNMSMCSFTVTINDTQAPAITCPANIISPATSVQGTTPGAVINYSAPVVSDNCPGLGAPVCTPVSGSFFPVGTNTVTCRVTAASATTSSSSFTITVGSPFPACCVDDASGNTISIVADPTQPLYGLWQLRIAATGQVLQGNAESI